jgi:hypothetical protein
MNTLLPLWIIGGPFVGLLILSFSFKGSSAMGGTLPRLSPRGRDPSRVSDLPVDRSQPLLEPMHPDMPRRVNAARD